MFQACDFQFDFQPLVIADDQLFIRTDVRCDDRFVLTLPNGSEMPLGVLCSVRSFQTRLRRRAGAWFRSLVETAVARRAVTEVSLLRLVIDEWLPMIRARDIGAAYAIGNSTADPKPTLATPAPTFSSDAIPHLELPTLALAVYGRLWVLADGIVQPRQTRIWLKDRCLVPTGDFWNVGTLNTKWLATAEQTAELIAGGGAGSAVALAHSPAVAQASHRVLERGAFEEGDLLYLSGNPPRLGCIIPAHYNLVVGNIAPGQYAITTSLRFPLTSTVTDFQVFRQSAARRWEPFQHSLCLGDRGHYYIEKCPPLAVWAHLRWAAERIATNQRFHVNDGAPHDEENG